MPTARDLLRRFRPVGAPGAAAPAGVPADRVAERDREVQPVFDELAATQAEAARIRDDAAARARARRDRAAAEAAAVVEAARRDAQKQRADTAAAILRSAQQETAAALTAAREEASAVVARAEGRYAGLVDRVVAGVRADAAATPARGPR